MTKLCTMSELRACQAGEALLSVPGSNTMWVRITAVSRLVSCACLLLSHAMGPLNYSSLRQEHDAHALSSLMESICLEHPQMQVYFQRIMWPRQLMRLIAALASCVPGFAIIARLLPAAAVVLAADGSASGGCGFVRGLRTRAWLPCSRRAHSTQKCEVQGWLQGQCSRRSLVKCLTSRSAVVEVHYVA